MRPVSKKLIAVVAGALIVGTPVALFNYWLNGLILEQIRDEVDSTARRSITLAEGRISQAMSALDDLARRGVATCDAEHLDALRRSNLDHSGIAEFSVLDGSGRTLCSDLGVVLRHRVTLTTKQVADNNMLLDVMSVDEGPQRMLRVRRPVGSGFIAALIPGDLLIAKVSTQGGPLLNAHGRLAAGDGTLLATSGPLTEFGNLFESPVISRIGSERFGLNVTMTRPRSMLSRGQEEMRFLGSVVNGVIALALLAVGILGPWRQHNNPVAEMERALRAGEFVPYFQPIMDITTGRMRGCEVLVRWCKPDGTLVSPATFIPLAESSGLIMDMTRSLMRDTVRELGAVCQRRPYLKIGFNLAAQHFADDRIVQDVRGIFEGSPIGLNQVVLEVTERQPLDNLNLARRVIGELQSLGVKVAIDDIGAGHSGLSYILKLGVDIIKIDKMFIDALGTESSSTAIIGTLVDLARNMDIELIAEGVETFEQVIALRERGIQAVQGYVFAPPLPGPSFLRLLEATDHHSEPQPEPDTASVRVLPSFGFGYLSSRRRASAA